MRKKLGDSSRNGADPKRVEIFTDQLMIERVLVVIKIFRGDIWRIYMKRSCSIHSSNKIELRFGFEVEEILFPLLKFKL